jgi:hypothetical protein
LEIKREPLYHDETEIIRDPGRHEVRYVLTTKTATGTVLHEIVQIPIKTLLFTQLII